MSTINSDEHSAKRYVRSVREQPTATERSDKPWAYFISTGQLRENKGESVSGAEWRRAERAGVLRRRTVSTDIHISKMVLAIGIMSDEKPISVSKPHFSDIPGKNDLDNDPL